MALKKTTKELIRFARRRRMPQPLGMGQTGKTERKSIATKLKRMKKGTGSKRVRKTLIKSIGRFIKDF